MHIKRLQAKNLLQDAACSIAANVIPTEDEDERVHASASCVSTEEDRSRLHIYVLVFARVAALFIDLPILEAPATYSVSSRLASGE